MKSFLILALFMIVACTPGFPAVMSQGPGLDAPKEMQEGWHDGCQSGISVFGNNIYKSLYSYKMDSSMITNKVYYNTWKDSYDYCRHWMNNYLKQGMLGTDYSDDLRDERVSKQGSGIMPDFLGW